MSETVIRKACDRCHHQKLSCKRTNEESCERCRKIQVTCTWSPSLRYKKNQQQHQQAVKQQRQQSRARLEEHRDRTVPPSTTSERRSPKRRRTGSDPNLVSPEPVPIVPQPGTGESQTTTNTSKPGQGAVAAVTSGSSGLDIREFDFNLGHFEFFDGPQQQQQLQHPQPLASGTIQGDLGHFHHHPHHHHHQQSPGFFGHWDHPLIQPHQGYLELSATPLPLAGSHSQEQGGISGFPLVQRSRVAHHTSTSSSGGSISTPRRRGRRLIALRASHDISSEVAGPSNSASDLNTPLHWMARLSEINTRLQALASLLPAQYEPADGGVRSQSFPVDEMFQLTRQIADVLDQLCTAVKDDKMPASEAVVPGRSAKLDGSDPGSAMFVLSVYVMLLDLYHKVFTLVRLEVFQQASNATFALWKLPDVTIGSFAVESTPSLQMSLTIQLAEEFLSRLRRSTAALDPSNRGPNENPSIFTGVVTASFQEIKSSEDSLRQELAALRERIEEMIEG
ncbi:hypothetical protein NLU13_5289 [Sarocladium strictum]|uniref:Zn(2)-C6 fungal-type domain-containing protein n=1 Tax=Sarocladium strictum TaxID=5046 RepID=A0AA39L7N0_SARSR|nr:hypothetical protein NLU13_5289 [Sarocladium strictum]